MDERLIVNVAMRLSLGQLGTEVHDYLVDAEGLSESNAYLVYQAARLLLREESGPTTEVSKPVACHGSRIGL